MGLPSKKRTPRSKRDRAAHSALKPTAFSSCPACGAKILPHHSCPACGMYRGKVGTNVKKRADRKLRNTKKA